MEKQNRLDIPASAMSDPKALELLQVWLTDSGQHISLQLGPWKDPAAWGLLLADLAWHIANAYHKQAGLDQANVLSRIKAGLNAEFSTPTSSIFETKEG